MIKDWQSHQEYGHSLHETKVKLDSASRLRLSALQPVRAKLLSLNLDPVMELLKPLYPDTGRPASNQVQILRSFILFCLLWSAGFIRCGLTAWVNSVLPNDLVYLALAGISRTSMPPLGSYYDFMNRLWLVRDRSRYSRSSVFADFKNRRNLPRRPSGKGQKAKDHPGVTKKLVRHILDGKDIPNPEMLLQKLLAVAAVLPSQKKGLIPAAPATVSGDGTAVHTHSTPFGHAPEHTGLPGSAFTPRHFPDPDASCGWDSDTDEWYFGFSLYHFSFHNHAAGIDLPLICRFTHASRHGSVSGMITLHQLYKNIPDVCPGNVCLDSAHDNYPTYELINKRGAAPFIDLNTHGRPQECPSCACALDKDGTPLCPDGHRMTYYGYDRNRQSFKWRCPFATGRIAKCRFKCLNHSEYGMTVYTKKDSDIRLFPPVPRHTDEWKDIYKNRTACERINNRILNDYGLHAMRIRGFDHYSFMTMVICICIHLDAWYKTGKL